MTDRAVTEEVWPALNEGEPHPWRKEPLDPERVAGLWRGEWRSAGPETAVIGTVAMALKHLGRTASMDEAEGLAAEFWRARTKERVAA